VIDSVKHGYERWEKLDTKLTTCNPNKKVFVTIEMPPQEIDESLEVVFTYDIQFKVQN
jgi:transmembrane 9 superfamily protein 2/4